MLREKLELLREAIASSDPKGAKALRPGLPREEVVEQLRRLPFAIAPDAVELYTWADGNDEELIELLPSGYFQPLESAVQVHLHLDDFRRKNWSLLEWEPDWDPYRKRTFCFLHDMSDGGYAFGGLDSPSEGQIVSLEIHHPATLGFSTLEHLVDTAIACRERGVFREEMPDFTAYSRIARELNPGMSAWEPFTGQPPSASDDDPDAPLE